MLAKMKGTYRNKNVSEFRIALWGVCVYLLLILYSSFIVCICFVCVSTVCVQVAGSLGPRPIRPIFLLYGQAGTVW